MDSLATATSKGLRLQVNRSGWESTNHGVSSTHDILTVVGVTTRHSSSACSALPSDCQLDEVAKDAPAVAIEVFQRGPYDGTYLSLVPVQMVGGCWVALKLADAVGPMNGGNDASSDAREWAKIVGVLGGDSIGLHIHDRFETVAQYAAMV